VKRVLGAAAVILLFALAGVAAGYLWYAHEKTQPLPEKRGSATQEFVTTAAVAKPRSAAAIRTEPWPTYGYSDARTRYAPDLRHRPPYRGVWSFQTGGLLEFPPIVSYGLVVAVQGRGRVVAIHARTGRLAWRKRFRRCAASSPAAGRGIVYVALMQPWPCKRKPRTQSGVVAAFNLVTGKHLWNFGAGAVESSPLLVGKTLYFGSWDRHLYALDVGGRRPRLKWKFRADNEVNSSAAYAAGKVFFGTDGGRIYAVRARTGREVWRNQSFSRFGKREYFYATPAVAYGRVYAASTDGNVYAYGATSGRLLWASNAGSYVYTAPAIWNRTVYVGSYDGRFYAFDAGTGARRWTFDARASIHGAPTVLGGLVYFATCGTCGRHGSRHAARGPRRTYALDARTGRLVWKYPVGHYSPVVADAERIYLASSTRIYALTDRTRATPKVKAKAAKKKAARKQR
jgi:outer membrane protein assembly factor BamB